MNLPKPNKINAQKYVAGLSLFNKKKQKLSYQQMNQHWGQVLRL